MISQEIKFSNPYKYKEQTMQYEDFSREIIEDVLVEYVNLSRATFKEAEIFRERIIFDILKNKLKLVVDLSKCDYIDSTFLGSLVVALKKMTERGGEIKYVIPQPSAMYLFKITGLYGVLNLYRNKEEAVESFKE